MSERDVSKNLTLNPFMDRSKPLTAAMGNLLASVLGDVVAKAYLAPAGDFIDRGLTLLRLLDESGFELRLKDSP